MAAWVGAYLVRRFSNDASPLGSARTILVLVTSGAFGSAATLVAQYNAYKTADPTRPIYIGLGQGVAYDGWEGRVAPTNSATPIDVMVKANGTKLYVLAAIARAGIWPP